MTATPAVDTADGRTVVESFRADDLGDRGLFPLIVMFTRPLPPLPHGPHDGVGWLEATRLRYAEEARRIADAMAERLPGGLLEALALALLDVGRSVTRVPVRHPSESALAAEVEQWRMCADVTRERLCLKADQLEALRDAMGRNRGRDVATYLRTFHRVAGLVASRDDGPQTTPAYRDAVEMFRSEAAAALVMAEAIDAALAAIPD